MSVSALLLETAFTPQAHSIGFGRVLKGREHEFPILAKALVGAEPANSTSIEWQDGYTDDGCLLIRKNYAQILREPFQAFDGTEVARRDFDHRAAADKRAAMALDKFLNQVEDVLVHGRASRTESGAATCGGVRFFLQRDAVSGDKLTLRILRDLTWLTNRQPRDADRREDEWLAEFSLQVERGQ